MVIFILLLLSGPVIFLLVSLLCIKRLKGRDREDNPPLKGCFMSGSEEKTVSEAQEKQTG